MPRFGIGLGLARRGRVQGDPEGYVSLAGLSAGSGLDVGALTKIARLAGQSNGSSADSGALLRRALLAGQSNGGSSDSGALTVTASWTPTTPGSPLEWFDGQASSVLYQDTAGTTPATMVGHTIARHNAQNGTNLTQSTSSARPAWSTTINGKVCPLYDGADDRLVSGQILAAGAKTFAFVLQHSSILGASESDTFATLSGGTIQNQFRLAGASATIPRLSWICDHTATVTGVGIDDYTPSTNRCIIVIAYNGGTNSNPGSYRCWLDGVECTVVARGSMGGVLGGNQSIGAIISGASPFGGAIGEVIVWSGDQSAYASQIYSYLNARW